MTCCIVITDFIHVLVPAVLCKNHNFRTREEMKIASKSSQSHFIEKPYLLAMKRLNFTSATLDVCVRQFA